MKLNNKTLALFGTSADPPTLGHQKIIEELSKIYNFVICYASNNPSKKHGENLYSRSLLLKTLIEDLNNPKILYDQELSSNWAINSVKKCQEKYNIKKINFVIGSDLINQIKVWKNIKTIMGLVIFIIIPREGYPIKSKDLEFLEDNNGVYEISSFKIPNISSSMIRSESNYSHLPESLIHIVKKKKLYN